MMDKEYFKIYYENHKKQIKNKHAEWLVKNPGKRKEITDRYKEKLKERGVKRLRDIKGPTIREVKLKPFKERISPELLAKMEENTRINNEKIKFFTLEDTKENIVARNIMRDLIKIKKGG